ncbi:MAG TPA: hydroxymethylbilane synthase, partial [Sphingomonadales bacterium]|nr:hydroxymethylbilane synthase [Sphingomonadales bacterium]
MDTPIIRIGTRASPLALVQARLAATALCRAAGPGLKTEIVPITTSGDRLVARALADEGGKGLFTKEIEEALLQGRVDIAVHSAKDLPAALPEGLVLAAFLKREDARDAFVSRRFRRLRDLPEGARVGTSSLRREAQLLTVRPDLKIVPLRGNVGTRLEKMSKGAAEATILACAGLIRLKKTRAIKERLPASVMLSAPGQ